MLVPFGRYGLWLAIFCLLCVLVPGSVLTARAQSSTPAAEGTPEAAVIPKFGIFAVGDFENPWFEVTIDAGQSMTLTAGIRNAGEVPVKLETFATNAINPPNGGFEAASEEDELIGPSLWIDYQMESFELQPDEAREQEFTVSIPEGTEPGEYVIALVVQTAESLAIPGTDALRQIIRSTISVEITVPGEMTSGFELGDPVATPAGADWILDVPITNTGTARVRPHGQLTVSTVDGEEVSSTEVEMGSVYGGNTTNVRATLPGQLPLGDYLVSLDLTDEATGESASISDAPLSLAEPVAEEAETLVVEQASVTPNGDPIQYADVAATITNNGAAIPTANVTLNVQRDGEDVESYPLAQNQALPNGASEFNQRYIPVDGWESGTWTFELVISAVSGGTETVLATIEIADEITVP